MKKIVLVIVLSLFVITGCIEKNDPVQFDVAISKDTERIAYSVHGKGALSLVFIHGWSCDSRYWHNQVSAFSRNYNLITIDLAGHGHSSSNRRDYTVLSFANDVKAVIEKENIDQAILIGHSMGGGVIAEAARLMPEKVVAIIGVDTLQNVAETFPQSAIDDMMKPFEIDFQRAMKAFVSPMFPQGSDAALVRWINDDMASAPKETALSAVRNYMNQYVDGQAAEVFKNVTVPVISINARLWPTNTGANRKHIQTYELFYIENTGHFPMLEKPDEFNSILEKVLEHIEKGKFKTM